MWSFLLPRKSSHETVGDGALSMFGLVRKESSLPTKTASTPTSAMIASLTLAEKDSKSLEPERDSQSARTEPVSSSGNSIGSSSDDTLSDYGSRRFSFVGNQRKSIQSKVIPFPGEEGEVEGSPLKVSTTDPESEEGSTAAVLPAVQGVVDFSFSPVKSDEEFDRLLFLIESSQWIKTLDLSRNDISSDLMAELAEALQSNVSIETLKLNENRIGRYGISQLARALKKGNQTLRTLELKKNLFKANAESALRDLMTHTQALTSLDLSGNDRFTESSLNSLLEGLAKNKTLTSLGLCSMGMQDKSLQLLLKSVRRRPPGVILRHLKLSDNELSSFGVEILGDYIAITGRELETLWLDRNKAVGLQGRALAKLFPPRSGLKILRLSGCKLSDDAGPALSEGIRLGSLTQLFLDHNALGQKAAYALSQALEYPTATITELDVSVNFFESGAEHLFSSLEKSKTLTKLAIAGNRLGPNSISALTQALERNDSLKSLNISENCFYDTSTVSLIQSLHGNTSLTHLNLHRSNITDTGAAIISSFLDEPQCPLRLLDLSENHIGPRGARALSQAIGNNKNLCLRVLDLGWNEIGDNADTINWEASMLVKATKPRDWSGVTAITKIIVCSTSLEHLVVSKNHITIEGVLKLAEALKSNSTLKLLDLRENDIGGTRGVEDIIVQYRRLPEVINRIDLGIGQEHVRAARVIMESEE